MPWRAFLATLLVGYALILLTVVVAKTIWPPERHPLAVDAKAPGCPTPTPVPHGFVTPRAPLNDPRRIA